MFAPPNYIGAIPQTSDPRIAVASVFSVIRNVSVPYGISSEDQPHISSTQWRVVADQKRLVYYFENVLTPNVLWVDLNKVDFGSKADVLKLSLDEGQVYAGDALGFFKKTVPFEFRLVSRICGDIQVPATCQVHDIRRFADISGF